MKDKLIILSGGVDSTTLLYKEKENIKMALSFYYGQKHYRETSYAKKNCEKLDIPYHFLDISEIGKLLNSSLLLNEEQIPEGHYQDMNMKKTVVPFRNGIMLSIACGIAESNNCKYVLIANHEGDHIVYPDCRPGFIILMRNAMYSGTYANIELEAPFTHLMKRDIVLIGRGLNIDYSLTWSCYKGREKHCGKCAACIERKEALEGFDKTEYEV
jgi:7-cyano-7-deazaguanine synthase